MSLVKSHKPMKIRVNTPLIFTHPKINRKLVINTGMNEIHWNYVINQNVQSTYGGEVTQILSAYVDAMTITGQTTDNDQLKSIYNWFLQYMNLAGLNNRTEKAIHMQYPERGWDFWLQVTNLSEYTLGLEKIATPWSITAQIMTDNDLNFLSTYTMSAMTESLFDPTQWEIGFNQNDPRNSPAGNIPGFGANFANNFQSLLGAWATGDFEHWGFDVLASPETNKLNPDASSYFTSMFGTNFIAGQPSNGSTGSGSSAYAGPQNPTGDVAIAGMINDIFETHGMPGKLGVTVAIIESGLDPNQDANPASVGLFQVQRPGQTPPISRIGSDNGTHFTECQKAFDNPSQPVTKYYSAYDQALDATVWFPTYKNSDLATWAANAQGPADKTGYKVKFAANLTRAENLISQYKSSAGGKGAAAAKVALAQVGTPYVWGGETPKQQPGAGFDCSGLCQYAYQKVGVSIPRVASDQQNAGHSISSSQLQPGDLIFLGNPAYHVVMFVGNLVGKNNGNNVVAAPRPGTTVQVEDSGYFIQNSDSGGFRRMT